MNLSPEQAEGLEKIKRWYSYGQRAPFRLFGAAGTGKTTLAKHIAPTLGLTRPGAVRYATYTGKAAHVLRSKGATPVSTIHSGIYLPGPDPEAVKARDIARARLKHAREFAEGSSISAEALPALEAAMPELERKARAVNFQWNAASEWSDADLIILDEVSMVDEALARDVERYGVPVLVLGDPAQLPPVDGGGYYTTARPDHLLDQVHRQALESPVLELATRVRSARGASLGITRADMRPRSLDEAREADQVLCWTNHRRWQMIKALRPDPIGTVVVGDRVMCLTNNGELGVFNGQQFTVAGERIPGAGFPLRDDEGREVVIDMYRDGFQGEDAQKAAKDSGLGGKGSMMLATYAQAITVHKAQGSEWRSVYLVNELDRMIEMDSRRGGELAAYRSARRFLYTAATRASEQFTITAPKGRR